MKNVSKKQIILLFVLVMILVMSSAYSFFISPLMTEKSDYDDKYVELKENYMQMSITVNSLSTRQQELDKLIAEQEKIKIENFHVYQDAEVLDDLLTRLALSNGLEVNSLSIGNIEPVSLEKTTEPQTVTDELTGEVSIIEGTTVEIFTGVSKLTYNYSYKGSFDNFIKFTSAVCDIQGVTVSAYNFNRFYEEVTVVSQTQQGPMGQPPIYTKPVDSFNLSITFFIYT